MAQSVVYIGQTNGCLDKEGIAQVSRWWCNSARLLQIVHGPADISKLQKPHCGTMEPVARQLACRLGLGLSCGAKHAH